MIQLSVPEQGATRAARLFSRTQPIILWISSFSVLETVVLRRWERSKQKFGFIKRVDKG